MIGGNRMSAIEKKILAAKIRTDFFVENACRRIAEKFAENVADDGYISTLVKILISVVLGVALLAALKTFVLDTFFPELSQQIMDMFTGGTSGGGGTTPP